MNKICFVNGSPRGNNSASKGLIGEVSEMLDKQNTEVHEICVVESLRHNTLDNDFEKLLNIDSIVFVFPLYIDAIPSNLLEYMYKLDEYIAKHPYTQGHIPARIYAVINNGFIEGNQNVNALKIMAHYAARIGCSWRFGIGIGAGEFVRESMESIPMKSRMKRNIYDALVKLSEDLTSLGSSGHSNIMTNPSMPKFMFKVIGNHHWKAQVKRSGINLSKKVWTEA